MTKTFHIRPLSLILPLLFASLVLCAQVPDDLEHTIVQVDNLLEQARTARDDAKAEQLAKQSLGYARDANYEGGIVRASMLLGDICARTARTEEALRYYLTAEGKVRATRNQPMLLIVCRSLGDLFLREKLYSNARRYYQEALILEPRDFETMEKAADTYLYDMRFDSAEILYRDLIVNYRTDGDNTRLVKIYQKLASVYNQNNLPYKALYYYIGIEEILDRFGNPPERAILYNNLGKQYVVLNDYEKALLYFRKAELQCEYITCEYPEVLYANLGIALHNTGKTREALEYMLHARDIVAKANDHGALANLEHLIATIYFSDNDLYNALRHNELAIQYATETNQMDVLAESYHTAADLYHELYDFEKAFDFYKKYLALLNSIRLEEKAKLNRLTQQSRTLTEAENQFKYLIVEQRVKESQLQKKLADEQNEKLALVAKQSEDALLLLQTQQQVNEAEYNAQILQALQVRQQLRLKQLTAERQEQEFARYRQNQEIDRERYLRDSTSQAQTLELFKRDKDISALTASKNAERLRLAYSLGALSLLILVLLGVSWFFARRSGQRLALQNRKIEAQKDQIEAERFKSDQLLLNILPEEIAAELKAHGEATPRFYPAATVLFTDFIDFTRLSTQLSPEALIDELDECFLAFDDICEKHRLEKIKTIGDAYMCAGGLPVPNDTHAVDAVRAALDMLEWLDLRNRANPQALFRHMRIGVHTGPVIAGVIGKNKFAYDIWGDAVNLAARLEALGEPGRINISSATRDAVKNHFQTSHRGKKEVHNKGQVDMYFIEGGIEKLRN